MNTYSLGYIDDLYVQYVKDPESVSPGWRQYFEQFLVATDETTAKLSEAAAAAVQGNGSPDGQALGNVTEHALWLARMQDQVDQLVREYRVRGHLVAQVDPLGMAQKGCPELNVESYGLTEDDLSRPFDSSALENVQGRTLNDVLQQLRNTYCRNIGAQFMHIDNRNIRDWLQRRMEVGENRMPLSHEVQRRIYSRLADATIFEEFVRRKFVGAKTFSLEGAESLIPLLDLALEKCGQHNVKEVVMAMAHRGRLNVLANIFKKRALNIFWSFDDPDPQLHRGGGDVRYHLGYSSDWKTASGDKMHISLCFNPSHLEYVNPVALGRTRCKQDRYGDSKRQDVVTILIHGDAAFAGEGVVQETLNLSQLKAYHTGGTLHVVINNQVGFTTEPREGRSTTYATDIAKMLQIPIFHVNGEDPEAVAQVVNLAMDFRREFHSDVVIDMYAYRRWGHNEGDEPRFTQPEMYREIDARQSVRKSYRKRLLKLGQMTDEEAKELHRKRQDKLEREFEATRTVPFVPDVQSLGGSWSEYVGGPEPENDTVVTGVDKKRLSELLETLTTIPQEFNLHRKLKRPYEQRREMAAGKLPVDWATGEALAFATLLTEGRRIRLTGQDSERGTFSQRHAVLHDEESGSIYTPLEHLAPDQAKFEIANSPLSEAGVLGFEYGYSLDCPEGLCAWEAQFGDFWNCAQVIVDQFIASAEDKWNRLSGLVMLLPHGFEGQGPEHCSSRVERFLAMAAEHNIQICQPTTPAQYFHLLRRQVLRRWRKPLICLTPKSLLRHPLVVSDLKDLEARQFRKILPDTQVSPDNARRILLCTGKVYYDLLEARKQRGLEDVAILRIEQLYPLKTHELMSAFGGYAAGNDIFWVQEEPKNMGAWPYLKLNYGDQLAERFNLHCVSRVESASPSTGSMRTHKLEQEELIEAAFASL
ncbi:2-oxoglutarate dehydrogenase E1 component [Rosistilla ulvae]|uniref:2-oxoglutarate dehydrogenase E1 component n=1 Tax=Rosistilla ulvae TaxID=1930277 RepID=A0A517LVH7_9BACT|nr:2-oxoglutarate dehydrogenase E1 component [Rosistilla ulvae]QDS86626.1 2-oxoglutarate dehydrogenase E1 component [Rosistilla ulvae]